MTEELELAPNRRLDTLPRISHKPKTKQYLIFDVETKLVKGKHGITKHYPFLICYCQLALNSLGKNEVKQEGYCTTVEAFYEVITKALRKHRSLTLVAHNIQYDAGVIDIFELFDRLNLKCKIFNPSHINCLIVFGNKRHTITIMDSLNYFSGKLAKLGKEIGIEKLKMPKVPKVSKAFIEYCKRDVEIIKVGLLQLSEIASKYGYGELTPTRAALSMKIYQSYFLKRYIQTYNDLDALTLEYMGYYGGRVECFKLGKMPKRMYYYLDVNSLYPSCMVNNTVSIKKRGKFDKVSIEWLKDKMIMHHAIAEVDLDTDLPIYPLKTSTSLLFPIGKFRTVLAHYELEEALKRGHVKKIHRGYLYFHANIFREYITHFHALKKKYKNEGKPIFTFFTKILLNSLYGKFGQKTPALVETGKKDVRRYDVVIEYDMLHKTKRIKKIINHDVYYETKKEVSPNSVPIIASEITSLSRLTLWKYIEIAGLENVYYSDTDSIITDINGFRKLRKYVKSNVLGALELEKRSKTLEINGLKDYVFGKQEVLKGIPKSAKKLDDGNYQFHYFSTLLDTLVQQGDKVYQSWDREKSLDRVYNKGLVLPSGKVMSWRLDLE